MTTHYKGRVTSVLRKPLSQVVLYQMTLARVHITPMTLAQIKQAKKDKCAWAYLNQGKQVRRGRAHIKTHWNSTFHNTQTRISILQSTKYNFKHTSKIQLHLNQRSDGRCLTCAYDTPEKNDCKIASLMMAAYCVSVLWVVPQHY